MSSPHDRRGEHSKDSGRVVVWHRPEIIIGPKAGTSVREHILSITMDYLRVFGLQRRQSVKFSSQEEIESIYLNGNNIGQLH